MLSIKLADIRNDARDVRPLWLAGGIIREDSLSHAVLLGKCKCSGQMGARKIIVCI
jgi:hypothetical protein